ncbi:ATP-dependent DNA ligase [Candidatus Dependentiae bacterium]|nr:ATP-dependent DNA ligase [Candidatus Dependentiae bacterium]
MKKKTIGHFSPKKAFNKNMTVTITHPEKIIIPPFITKNHIVTYYEKISPMMVPYMKDHPLMMQRFPQGIEGEAFFQKNASPFFPSWIKRVQIPKEGGYTNTVVCQNRATLLYLANLNCLTPHLWLSRFDKLHFPDRLIIDLDPSGDDFNHVRQIALSFKELFDSFNLISFVMTTGSRGLHVTVPLDRSVDFAQIKEFISSCSLQIEQKHPSIVTREIHKEKRGGKVFIDEARNNYGSTAVAPYAIRGRAHGPIATPLHWHEVEDETLHSQLYTLETIFKRIETIEDPWKDFLQIKQSLSHLVKK